VEVEAKFRVPDPSRLDRLASAPRIVGYDLDAPIARHDSDTFLDTADRRLLAAGYYLRRRENADGVRITLKRIATAENGVLRREELEQRAAADVPLAEWPRGPLRERVMVVAAGADLVPLLTLAQDRRTRVVRRVGAPVAELSLDAVTVSAGGRDERWFEVEAELVGDGGDDDLAKLSEALREVWDLTPEPSSKFARALAALDRAARVDAPETAPAKPRRKGGSTPKAEATTQAPPTLKADATSEAASASGEAVAAQVAVAEGPSEIESGEAREGAAWRPRAAEARRKRPPIRGDDSMVEAAVAVMRLHYAKMLAHQKGTRAGDDPEELHDMRVATRRLRMAVRLFTDHLDADTMRPVLKGLRRTGRTLGAVRDLDVFREKTIRYVEGLPRSRRSELRPLLDAWQVEYDARRAEMVAYLEGRRYGRFVEYFGALLAGPPDALAAAGEGQGAKASQVLPALLHRDLADVLAAGSLVDGAGTPLKRFHELRIAGKALRYTLEFFEMPLGRGARPLIEATKTLQDHLGDLQDAVVSCGIVRDVLTWGTWAREAAEPPRHTDIVLAPGLCRYLVARQNEMERLVVTFPEVWPAVAGEQFGGRLAGLLARL
jgi:CHAD domain-containing protein